jgi:hypothetical protein
LKASDIGAIKSYFPGFKSVGLLEEFKERDPFNKNEPKNPKLKYISDRNKFYRIDVAVTTDKVESHWMRLETD